MSERLTREAVVKLAALYQKRADLQKLRETANLSFWGNLVNEAFGGTGTRSSVCNGVGGAVALVHLFNRAVDEKLLALMIDIDNQIIDLGGEP